MLENEAFEIFFAKSAKEEGAGGSENSGKNLLSQTRCIFVDDPLDWCRFWI